MVHSNRYHVTAADGDGSGGECHRESQRNRDGHLADANVREGCCEGGDADDP